MKWSPSEDEVRRFRALDDGARYTIAINRIRLHGELWTLGSAGTWAQRRIADGVSAIAIWPHARFAELEAVGELAGARPVRLSLGIWLGARRAAWFAEHGLWVSVFPARDAARSVAYAAVAEALRGATAHPKDGSGRAPARKRTTRTTGDLVTYVSLREIDLVLDRIPRKLTARVRKVYRKRSSDAAVLGQVTRRGRRDINLTVRLPIRLSLQRYLLDGQSPAEFGAPPRGQWPPWAVRRFLLYDVLLHEIGHLQVVDPQASRERRRFASEIRAQAFSDELRRSLYSRPFAHADPIHNAPSAAELATLAVWERLDKSQRAALVALVLAPPPAPDLAPFGPLTGEQEGFLRSVTGGGAAAGRR